MINSNNYPDNPNIKILEFLNNQPGFKGKMAAFASRGVLAKVINRNRNGLLVNIPYEDIRGPHLTPMQKETIYRQHYIPARVSHFTKGRYACMQDLSVIKNYFWKFKFNFFYLYATEYAITSTHAILSYIYGRAVAETAERQ